MHLFGVRIVCVGLILFELFVIKKKTMKKERRTKSEFSHSIFLTVRRSNGTLEAIYDIRIVKGFYQ